MQLWLVGTLAVVAGTLEQFLVNESRAVAIIVLIAGLWAWRRLSASEGECPKWAPWLVLAASLAHVAGLVSDRWLVYTGLGVLLVAVGVVLMVAAFRAGRPGRAWQRVARVVGTVAAVALAVPFLAVTFAPSASFAVFKQAINAYGNVTEAEPGESALANGATCTSDIRYDDEYPNGFLDVYHTATPNAESPATLVFIHGGGYANGDKAAGDPNAGGTDFADTLAYRALSEGYNVVELNYCLMTEHVFPDQIIQLNGALRYLREHADELGLNMGEVFLSGGSAGGNLAGVIACLETNPAYAAEMGLERALEEGAVHGVIFISALLDNSQYGVTHNVAIDYMFYWAGRVYLGTNELVHDREVSRLSNVIDNVTADFPPCLISDGNSGSFFDQAFAMNGRCVELGVESELVYFPPSFGDLPHGYEDLGSDQARIVQDRMVEFMAEHA